jgi:preprotein translocase subunit SecA
MRVEEDQEIKHPWLDRCIQLAQRRQELRNLETRKRGIAFDWVLGGHRKEIYRWRSKILALSSVHDELFKCVEQEVDRNVIKHVANSKNQAKWDLAGLTRWLSEEFPLSFPEDSLKEVARTDPRQESKIAAKTGLTLSQHLIRDFILITIRKSYQLKDRCERPNAVPALERYTMLSAIDDSWTEHLETIAQLRHGMANEKFTGVDPLTIFQSQADELFRDLQRQIQCRACHGLFRSASGMDVYQDFLRKLAGTEIGGNKPDYSDAGIEPAR